MRHIITGLLICLTCGNASADNTYDDWMNTYYQDPQPDQLVSAFRDFAKRELFKAETSHPPAMAFFGCVMRANPDKIAEWLDELNDLDESHRKVLLSAAWFSRTDEAKAYFRQHDLNTYLEQEPPQPLTKEIDHPTQLDMLWGCFLATGEEEPIRRVVSAFELSKYLGALKKYPTSAKTEEDRKNAYLDATFQSAQWSLASNCKQHEKVLEHCETIFQDEKLPATQKLWLGVVLSQVKPDVYSIETKP